MAPLISTFSIPAADFLEQARGFYEQCGRKTSIEADDILVVALVDDAVGGIVRLCYESGTYTLRTMQIRPDLQRRGLGSILLEKFDDLIREKEITEIFCMPYDHLKGFYGQIGFMKILCEAAPVFLQDRVRQYAIKHPDQSVILMRRKTE